MLSLGVADVPFALGLLQAPDVCSQTNRELFVPKFHADCDTQGIVYLMLCQCGAFYVGKTTRHFRYRFKDHVYYSANGKMVTTVSRHLDLYHKFNVSLVSFIALAVVPRDSRGGISIFSEER